MHIFTLKLLFFFVHIAFSYIFLFLCCWCWFRINDWGLVTSLHSWQAEKRKWKEESGGGGVGGVRHEESSFCGKNLLSLQMLHREDDKYSGSNRAMNRMLVESYLTELHKPEWVHKKNLMYELLESTCVLLLPDFTGLYVWHLFGVCIC